MEQRGLVKVVVGGSVRSKPYLDLRSKTTAGGERGLLGIAFSPKFKTDGRVYVNYTDKSGNTVVARYTAPTPSSSAPKWGTPKRLLYIRQPFTNHNGGCLQFGPDGYLYIGMGDGGSGGDPGNRAQNRSVLLGKMLRINPAKSGATKPYLIPPTNPSRLTKSASLRPRSEVWALGVRNPWRFSFDSSTGTLWLADVGQRRVRGGQLRLAVEGRVAHGQRRAELRMAQVRRVAPLPVRRDGAEGQPQLEVRVAHHQLLPPQRRVDHGRLRLPGEGLPGDGRDVSVR